jgi:translation initiation factor IF-2
MVIGFNVKAPRSVLATAQQSSVDVHFDNVIYRLMEEVTKRITDLLPTELEQRVLAEATIQQVFQITVKGRKTAPVAGCKVTNGVLRQKSKVRVLRNRETIYQGTLESLKHHKKDADHIQKGSECGLSFVDFTDFAEGDTVQTYEEIEKPKHL